MSCDWNDSDMTLIINVCTSGGWRAQRGRGEGEKDQLALCSNIKEEKHPIRGEKIQYFNFQWLSAFFHRCGMNTVIKYAIGSESLSWLLTSYFLLAICTRISNQILSIQVQKPYPFEHTLYMICFQAKFIISWVVIWRDICKKIWNMAGGTIVLFCFVENVFLSVSCCLLIALLFCFFVLFVLFLFCFCWKCIPLHQLLPATALFYIVLFFCFCFVENAFLSVSCCLLLLCCFIFLFLFLFCFVLFCLLQLPPATAMWFWLLGLFVHTVKINGDAK